MRIMAMARTIRPEKVEKCITECMDCHAVCLDLAYYSLNQGGELSEPDHIKSLMDCADLCRTSVDFMLRGSDFSAQVCELNAEVCDQCAESCYQFKEDAKMKAGGDICRRTASSCREMAQ